MVGELLDFTKSPLEISALITTIAHNVLGFGEEADFEAQNFQQHKS
jgi:hypothetical protein